MRFLVNSLLKYVAALHIKTAFNDKLRSRWSTNPAADPCNLSSDKVLSVPQVTLKSLKKFHLETPDIIQLPVDFSASGITVDRPPPPSPVSLQVRQAQRTGGARVPSAE